MRSNNLVLLSLGLGIETTNFLSARKIDRIPDLFETTGLQDDCRWLNLLSSIGPLGCQALEELSKLGRLSWKRLSLRGRQLRLFAFKFELALTHMDPYCVFGGWLIADVAGNVVQERGSAGG